MKLGIIGLPQTGKKLLFQLLTGTDLSKTAVDSSKPLTGIAEIRDNRFDKLVNMYNPKKEAPARIDLKLLPRFETGSDKENELFREIADADALLHVVRSFEDESVYHVNGSVDAQRDIESVNGELCLQDLLFIEKRLERIERDRRKKEDPRLKEEEALIIRFREHLEKDLPLRTLEITDEEKTTVSGYPFMTFKRMLVVLNIGEDDIGINTAVEKLTENFKSQEIDILAVPVKLEQEIALLETEEEQKEFMEEAGITESALSRLSGLAMKSLGLMSYFTVGEDEVKQWLVRIGASAPEAAGVIHSDLQRGFIRAEVIKYLELIELGSEEAVKKAGKFLVMGKDYIVEDGDIINFRFNV